MENIKELRKRLDVDGLIKALSYSDWHVRRDATSALGKIVDRKTVSPLTKAVEPLIKTLKDEKAEVRSAAASALSIFVIYGIIDALDEKAKEAGEALEEALREALKDADKNIAWSLAVNLASIPVPVTLEREERLVRRTGHVDLEGFHSGLLLLTNRRLIYNEAHFDGSFSCEMPLEDIASCEVKGKEKLVVVSRRAVIKQRLHLVTEGDMWRYEEARILETEPEPLGFKGIKQPETLRSEIMEQVEICKKAFSQK